MPLICTGTIGIDTVYTPHGNAERVLGGSCTYFAAAASFHGPVRIVAAVGGDFDLQYRDVFKSFPNIDITGLETRQNGKTFAWAGRYHENMNNRETLFTELGVVAEKPPEIPASYQDSEYVFLANSHPGVQMDLLNHFPKRRLAVADTMDLWIKSARKELEALLRKVDGLVLNNDEAEQFTGKKNPVTAGRHILKDFGGPGGLQFVILKKGEHGCIIIHREGIAALPAYPAEEVIDPTGAGDTFAGGMMGYIAAQGTASKTTKPGSFETIQQAVSHGTVVASFNIESFSLTRLQKLKKGELDARFKEFAKMVRV